MENKNSKKIITILLFGAIAMKSLFKIVDLMLMSENQIISTNFKSVLDVISIASRKTDSSYVIPIVLWIWFIVLISDMFYKGYSKKSLFYSALTLTNIILYNGFSESFFNHCSSYIIQNYKMLLIVFSTVLIFALFSSIVRKISIAKKEISLENKDMLEPNREQEKNENIAITEELEEKEIDIHTTSNIINKTASNIKFEKHPYLSTVYKLRDDFLKTIRKEPKEANDQTNIFISFIFLIIIFLLLGFIIFCVKSEVSFDVLLQDFFDNLEGIFETTNSNTQLLEAKFTKFILSFGILLLIPIAFLLIVLVFVFSFTLLFYSITRTKILKKYIDKIVDRIEYFFFETILNTINPFILIPDFVSTVVFTVFGIDVEEHVNDKINKL